MIRKSLCLILFCLIPFTLIYSDKEITKGSPFYQTYQRGRNYFNKKQYEKAIKEFRRLIKEKPDLPQPYLNLAMIYEVHHRNYGQAIKYYIKYLEKGGKKVNKIKKIIKDIANLRYKTGDVEFKKLEKGDRLYLEGVKLAKKKRYGAAINRFKQSLEIIPYYVKAHYAIAVAYNKKERYLKAYEHFMKVIKYDPDNPVFLKTYYYLGILHDDLLIKDYDAALRFYQIYEERNGRKDVKKFMTPLLEVNKLIKKSIKQFEESRTGEALKTLEQARQIKPDDIRLYNNIAAIYINQGEYKKAEMNLEKAMKIRKHVGDTYYNYTCLYSKQNNREKALEYFKEGIKYFSEQHLRQALNDPDLKNIRKESDFARLIKEYFQ